MQNSKFQLKIQKLINPLTIIALAVILRLVPHIPNVAPIAAMALFGGTYLNKKYALIVPLVAMVLSDIFLGFSSVTPFVYGSFVLTGLIGLLLKKHKNIGNIALASVAGSIIFFIITNLGVWAVGGLYSHTWKGLEECFVLALPFFRNTVLGDFFYVTVLFGIYEIVHRLIRHPELVSGSQTN